MTDANTLEGTLKNQQWVGGQLPTQADVEAYNALKSETFGADSHPHTFAWFVLVSKFTDAVKATWPAGGAAAGKGGDKGGKKGGKKEEKKEAKPADDDMDLFGDDDEASAAAAKAAAEKVKDDKKKKAKKEVIAQSLVLFEVKPQDDETNLDDLAKKIIETITGDGIYWKTEYKKEPVAFGIYKLIIGVTVEDEKVSVDDIVERIEGITEEKNGETQPMAQSVEIAAFNKI